MHELKRRLLHCGSTLSSFRYGSFSSDLVCFSGIPPTLLDIYDVKEDPSLDGCSHNGAICHQRRDPRPCYVPIL
ncbi:unnamed protein product [Lactuca virosa]|uniref:Uncharacterized protein n=1 Tax=Lactuca virosa TaxID=75947 RepID=A0AAU9NFG1_9ASTR|nr:unnamed protein product [Lactuca virosa]